LPICIACLIQERTTRERRVRLMFLQELCAQTGLVQLRLA
jgi:hypothetical protein